MPFLTQGKTNWKFLLIIIILALIVAGGALYCYLKFPGVEFPSIKFPFKPEKKIIVITDKTEYGYVGETEGIIKLTVKNNSAKSICFESCNTYYLLEKKDNKWEEVGTKLCEFNTITECLKPTENKIFEYITTWTEKGTYKFAVPIFSQDDLKDFPFRYYEIIKTIYSNEFTIHEKDETADWKTYRNEEYGFEIKFPKEPNWEGGRPSATYITSPAIVYKDTLLPGFLFTFGKIDESCVAIGVFENPKNLSMEEFYLDEECENICSSITPSWMKNSIKFEKTISMSIEKIKTCRCDFDYSGIDNTVISFSAKNRVYEIWKNFNPFKDYRGPCKSAPNINEVFNQMLSTFRFLE